MSWGGLGSPQGVPAPLGPAVAPQPRSGRDSKRCQLRQDEEGHLWLSGVARRFCSLRELLGTSGCRGLQAEWAEMHLEATCPSHPKGDTRGCPRESCEITEWL